MRLSNLDARRLWLHNHGLGRAPTGPFDVMDTIRALGFVQIDTIRNVTRAHHHILWSRNQNYREKMLWPLLQKRQLFEHFTHDASLIPMEYLPNWQRQFQRLGDYIARSKWFQTDDSQNHTAAIKARIKAQGPLSTHAFNSNHEGKREMWARPPHKKALDKMWYAGELATSHRNNFVKFYDLAERVFPAHSRADLPSDTAQINWLCNNALNRMGFASPIEIARFWDAVQLSEVRIWGQGIDQVEIETAEGSIITAWGAPDISVRLETLTKPTSRMRIINPFDPAIRDRKRLKRLFGFDYKNEMFVPEAKRKWGYYVYPLLECDRFVGRIELKADRKAGWLRVTGFWPETDIKWTKARQQKLDAELARLARFIAVSNIDWQV